MTTWCCGSGFWWIDWAFDYRYESPGIRTTIIRIIGDSVHPHSHFPMATCFFSQNWLREQVEVMPLWAHGPMMLKMPCEFKSLPAWVRLAPQNPVFLGCLNGWTCPPSKYPWFFCWNLFFVALNPFIPHVCRFVGECRWHSRRPCFCWLNPDVLTFWLMKSLLVDMWVKSRIWSDLLVESRYVGYPR